MNAPVRQPLACCVIGLGRIASLLEEDPLREKPCTHAGAITASPECFLAGGMDIDPERREAFARRWGCPVFASAETMLRELKPSIVHIATHPDSHLEYALLAGRLGVPVAVCEKPLANTLGAARKIAAIPRRCGTKILVNHERRYSLDYRAARNIAASGALGRLLGVTAKLYMGKNRPILDVLWHDGTHIADAIAFLTGGVPRHRKTCGSPLDAQSGGVFLAGEIRLEDRTVPLCLEVGAGRDHIVFEIDLSFDRGRIRIGNGVYEIWKSAESPYARGFRSLALETQGFSAPPDRPAEPSPCRPTGCPTGYFANMQADAVRLAREGGEPVSGATEALRVIEYLTSVSRWNR